MKENKTSSLVITEDDDSAKFTRDDFIYLAKMSEQCERYDEMLGFVRKFIHMPDCLLTPEEKHVFAAAYKNAVGNRRAELRVLTVIEQREQRRTNYLVENSNQIARYRKVIEGELSSLCYELIKLIDEKLLPISNKFENQIYFKKMRGDYYRYLAEFMTEEDCSNIIENCEKSYYEAEKLAETHLQPTHPLKLGLMLNISVFEYEVAQRPARAVQIASSALDKAFANIDKIKEDSFKESTLIMQLLRDNLTLWSSDSPAEANNDN